MRIGLIGCGKQAPKHIAGLRSAGVADIVLYDINPDRARALAAHTGLRWVEQLTALLVDPELELIIIATPTPTHASLIRAAIDAGKHFFCEKPLCDNLADARSIRAASRERGVIGMVGYIYRFAPVFSAGLALSPGAHRAELPLGRPVTAWFRLGGRGASEMWKHRIGSGGGAASEMLVHMLDLAIWYFGAVRGVSVIASDLLRPVRNIGGTEVEVDAEDFVLIRLHMEHCGSVFVQSDLVTPAFNQSVEVQYEEGSFFGSIQSEVPSYIYASRDVGEYRAGRNALQGGGNLFDAQMKALVDCVRCGEPPDANSIEDSLALMEAWNMLQREGISR